MDMPRLLVLRLWISPALFRAVVRELEPERMHQFTDAQSLVEFLLGDAGWNGRPGPARPATVPRMAPSPSLPSPRHPDDLYSPHTGEPSCKA